MANPLKRATPARGSCLAAGPGPMSAGFRGPSMASLTDTRSRPRVEPGLGLAVALIGTLTVIRVVGLHASVVDLFFDEAQYWAWSRELAFGYFSKPPLLAWTIAGAERVCGASEACIRAPAPLLYFGTSLLVYAIARMLYDARVAFFAALSTALAMGTAFSSRIISTDVPLLFFWALALLAYVKLLDGAPRWWAAVLGLALGLGLMAKYAMVYFLLSVALTAALDRDARALLRTPAPWIAVAIAVLVVVPNIVWNFENGFATYRHTGDNIQGGGLEFSLRNGLAFFASQFVVFGPVVFAVLLAAIARIASPAMSRADRLMLAFALPPLVLVGGLGFVTRALANWAAPAFVSAVIVAVAILLRRGAWKWLAFSLGLGVAAQALLVVTDAMATRLHVPGLTRGDIYQRT